VGKKVGKLGIPVVSDIADKVSDVAQMFGFGKMVRGKGFNDVPSWKVN